MATLSAVILAAGQGTRMKSDLPKVAHVVAGKPMVWWVARACVDAGCERVIVVVGYKQEIVRAIFRDDPLPVEVEFVEQGEQLGTGHAVVSAKAALSGEAKDDGNEVLVLAGDGPLITAETLKGLRDAHRDSCAVASMATARIDDPTGYGRIIRDASGRFIKIVEQKNATDAQREINEINPSYYCFDVSHLFRVLETVERNELTGEYYITDVPKLLKDEGHTVTVVDAVPADDVHSVNNPEQLALVDAIFSFSHWA